MEICRNFSSFCLQSSNHKADILCAVLTHNDEFIITGTYDRLVNVIRLETGDLVHSVEKHFVAITAIAISLDDTILVTGTPELLI